MNKILIFSLGALTGAAVAYAVTRMKYEKLINEEIESVKAAFSKEFDTPAEEKDSAVSADTQKRDREAEAERQEELKNYNELVEQYLASDREPYVISPDEYETDSVCTGEVLHYYANGYLTDDFGNIIHNTYDTIGTEALDIIEDAEGHVVYVRNLQDTKDYEIHYHEESL